MNGFIKRRHVVRHAYIIIHGYGWRVFWVALTSGKGKTFLQVCMECKIFENSARKS